MEEKDRLLTPVELSALSDNEWINGRWYYNPYQIARAQRDLTARMVAEEIFGGVDELWKPKHHNLCYGIIDPHPECICCKYQALKSRQLGDVK